MQDVSESRPVYPTPLQHTSYALAPLSVYIRKRDTGSGRRFDVAYRLHGRYGKIGHAGTFKSEREAKLRKRKVEDWIAEAKDPGVELARFLEPGLTVAEVADRWLRGKRRVRASTVAEYQRRIDRFAIDFKGVEARALTVDAVNEWIDGLSLKASTVGEYVTTLRAILDHAGVDNVARDRRVELPRAERRLIEPPDADATLAVLRCLTERFRPVCVLMEQTGLRVSEACNVQPVNFDRTRSRLLVPVTKTGQPRWTGIQPWLLELLDPPWQANRQTVHNALKAACKEAGVVPFGPHMLRHRRASLWSAQGVAPAQAAAWLGHTVETYLRTYTHVVPVGEIEARRLAMLLQTHT